jgi:hypothetical protein
MREGLDADDGWRLVEDEFEMTARLFTRHLHHGELQRQKQLARTRNQGAVDAITGPLDGQIQPNIQDKTLPGQLQAEERSKKTVAAIHDANNGQGDDPWLSDPRLAGLMSNKHNKAPLAKIGALQSTSRAAHGYSKGQASPHKRRTYVPSAAQHDQDFKDEVFPAKQEDSDSDGLDGPSLQKNIKSSRIDTETSGPRSIKQHNKIATSVKKGTGPAPRLSNTSTSKTSKRTFTAPATDSSDDDASQSSEPRV